MAEEEVLETWEPTSDQGGLGHLERVGKGTAIASEIYGLVGKSLFFAEFSREDIVLMAGYMEVYRAQPGEIIIREGDGGDYMLLIVEGFVDILKRGMRHEQHTHESVVVQERFGHNGRLRDIGEVRM